MVAFDENGHQKSSDLTAGAFCLFWKKLWAYVVLRPVESQAFPAA
jgi:hypothetical protein